jgi:hypothetical protein
MMLERLKLPQSRCACEPPARGWAYVSSSIAFGIDKTTSL